VCDQTLATLDTIASHTATINAIVRVGQEVWSCGNDRKIVTYNLEGEVLQSIDNADRVLALAYQPSCMRVWSTSADGLVAVWDARVHNTLHITPHALLVL
jgi:WD40 repeat protein